jgi:hypothetical protein
MHRLHALALLLVPLASGCGDNLAGISIETVNPPAWIAFRDDASAEWQDLTDAQASTFEVIATGPYQVVVACHGSGGAAPYSITQYARALEDGPSLEHPCRNATYPFKLDARVVQPGMIFFGNFGRGTTSANWDLQLQAAPGSFDLVMFPGDLNKAFEQIAIRRDVSITGDTDLGTIDISQEGLQSLVPITFTVSNLQPGEYQGAATELRLGGTYASIGGPFDSGWTTGLVPESSLRATDSQGVELRAEQMPASATDQTRFRTVRRPARVGDSTSVVLPEPLGPVTFETSPQRFTAAWSTLPAHNELVLEHLSSPPFPGLLRYHKLVLSRAFLEATGATSATLALHEVPGFQAEWNHDTVGDHFRIFTARRGSMTENESSGTSEYTNVMAAAGALRRAESLRRALGELP